MLTNMGNRFTHYEPRFINSGQGSYTYITRNMYQSTLGTNKVS